MTATIAAPTLQERASVKVGTGVLAYVGLLGRIFYSAIFILSGPNHFKAATIGYAAAQGVPLASITVPLSGIIGRSEHCAGLPGQARRVADRVVPGSRESDAAPLLGTERSPSRRASAGHVHEERVDAGGGADHCSGGLGTTES